MSSRRRWASSTKNGAPKTGSMKQPQKFTKPPGRGGAGPNQFRVMVVDVFESWRRTVCRSYAIGADGWRDKTTLVAHFLAVANGRQVFFGDRRCPTQREAPDLWWRWWWRRRRQGRFHAFHHLSANCCRTRHDASRNNGRDFRCGSGSGTGCAASEVGRNRRRGHGVHGRCDTPLTTAPRVRPQGQARSSHVPLPGAPGATFTPFQLCSQPRATAAAGAPNVEDSLRFIPVHG